MHGPSLQFIRIQPCNDLALAHVRIEVDEDFIDTARNFGAYGDFINWLQRARSSDGCLQPYNFRLAEYITHGLWLVHSPPNAATEGDRNKQ